MFAIFIDTSTKIVDASTLTVVSFSIAGDKSLRAGYETVRCYVEADP